MPPSAARLGELHEAEPRELPDAWAPLESRRLRERHHSQYLKRLEHHSYSKKRLPPQRAWVSCMRLNHASCPTLGPPSKAVVFESGTTTKVFEQNSKTSSEDASV